jgi:LL-diaminopimelate aminotransferase
MLGIEGKNRQEEGMNINATRGPLEVAAYGAGLISDLGLGNPLCSPPLIGLEARDQARRHPEAHYYAPTQGLADTIEAVQEFSANVDEVPLEREQVLISECGTAWLLRLLAEQLLTDEGPFTAIIPWPRYGKHLSALSIPGVRVVMVDYHNSGKPYAELLEGAVLQHRPRIIVDSSVRNPTAAIIEGPDFTAAVSLAQKHGAILFMDDAYRHIFRTRRGPIPSVLATPGALDAEVVTTVSFSKGFRWPALRAGMLLGHPGVIAKVQEQKDAINEGGDPAAQIAMAALLRQPEILAETRRGYDDACPTLVGLLRENGWENATESDASIFLYCPIPTRWEARGLDSAQLCAAAANRGVIMYDDRRFDGDGKRVRICMRGNRDQWVRAAEVIGDLIDHPERANFSLPA